MREDIKTEGIVLRRTNYGEADRILNLITPVGKIAAIAKGVRRPKSKLAGGIEMFSLVKINIHQGRGRMGVVTSAQMVKYYDKILRDFGRMELAGLILQKINKVSDQVEEAEYFEITLQCLEALDTGVDTGVVESWFWLNLRRVMGEEMNLHRDINGEKLRADERYMWDVGSLAFVRQDMGEYGADEIKIMRLMVTTKLGMVKRIKMTEESRERVLNLVRIAARVV